MNIVNLRETRDQALLERVYHELYLTCFTDPDEQEDLEQYRSRLFDPQLAAPQPVTHFLVALDHASPVSPKPILGMLICELYRESACGLLTYLAVTPNERRMGVGRKLVEQGIQILSKDCTSPQGLQGVFAETHDPALVHPEQDSMHPGDRIEVMRRLGAYRIPIHYVQPALRPGRGRSAKLILLAFPSQPGVPPVTYGTTVQDFLTEFYRALQGGDPSRDADFQRAKADIARAVKRNPAPELVTATDGMILPLAPLLTPDRPMFRGGTTYGLLLAWLLAVVWYYGVGYLIGLVPDNRILATIGVTSESHWALKFAGKHGLIGPLHFLLQVFRGAGTFILVVLAYRTPFLLLVRSTFPFDEPLSPELSWGIWRRIPSTARRLFEIQFYYANLISLSAVRRFLYVATHPIFYWKFWRVLNVSPNRVYTKLQLYIEAELFNQRLPHERPREYGERIAKKYIENLAKYDKNDPSDVPVLDCQTCFDIFGSNHDKIVSYFNAQVSVHRDPRFLTRIVFESGYIAPTHLVSGLLSEFDEDWTKIVDAYPDMVDRLRTNDPLKDLPQLRKLQSFIWDCWVQWGPSVPISGSPAWRSGEVAVQFGYGDENNSLPLRWNPAGRTETGWRGARFEDWQKKLAEIKSSINSTMNDCGWAWPVKVSGNLRWLMRAERNSRFCLAQFAKASLEETRLRDEHEADQKRQPQMEQGWLVFDSDQIDPKPGAPLFYSAYLWVMITICRSTQEPVPADAQEAEDHRKHASRGYRLIHADPQDQWRCLIPFFQHSNIADRHVYESIKYELALKTVETLIHNLRVARDEKGIDWLHFAFAAAYDDNGDAAANLRDEQDLPGSDLLSPCIGVSIHDLMTQILATRFKDEPLARRIHSQHGACNEISADQMPQIVRTYLNHVDELSEAE